MYNVLTLDICYHDMKRSKSGDIFIPVTNVNNERQLRKHKCDDSNQVQNAYRALMFSLALY